MPRRLILAAVATVLGAVAGAAQAADIPGDTNHDGKISQAEFMAARKAQILQADSNKDGKVSSIEFARNAQKLNSAIATRGYPSMGQGTQKSAFYELDVNGDSVLDGREIDIALRDRFTGFDTNRDGFLAGPELAAVAAANKR